MSDTTFTIGTLGKKTGLSIDTLRYYEKIDLLREVSRHNGQRRYTQLHLEQLLFIRRAQAMDFSLAEIAQLLKLRIDPVGSRNEVRMLAEEKLDAVNQRIKALTALQQELGELIGECRHSGPGVCPIIKGLERSGDKNEY
ncbi:MAG: heavy metal-responsive transcriptional regulator [Gammaproteobacteria bacterium]|nr:heavy metal-responsive transcriptional regulator [Gammaproteobacteria bacterium]